MHRRLLLFILFSLSVGMVAAQQSLRVNPKAISVSSTGSGKIYHANFNEPPRAIEFIHGTVTSLHFLSNVNQYFDISSDFTFVETESNTDNLGMRHRFLQQYYKGIQLEGLGYRVHEKNGFVTSANGKAVRNINLDLQTTIDEEQAFHLAVKYLNTKDTVFRHGKKLIVSKDFVFTPESFSVAFQFDIDVSFIEQWRISIDARTGEIVNKVSLVNSCFEEKEPPLPYGTATGLTNYYGNKTIRVERFDGSNYSRLRGQTENGGLIQTFDFQNVNVLSLLFFFEYHKAYDIGSSGDYTSSYHKPAVSAQWGAEQAFEYYFKKHGRNSFDNNGALIKSYVHVDQNMNNAFWVRNLMAFGDGDNNNPLVELDIVAHELTHGVTQFEAGLNYSYESGALNESFSDIFGKAVEFETFGSEATWQLARHNREGGFRNMSNPNLKNHPDTYAGDYWYTGNEDAGGVHYNSSVQNFWFYLLCEGGNGVNDHGANYSINSIGMEAATKIAYRNLTEYLSSTSDYLDSKIGSLLAAADLYGKNSPTYLEVDKAWDAVGVIDEPIIDNLEVYDITATTVKLKGNFAPRADTATYHFEYGPTPAFGTLTEIKGYDGKVEDTLRGLNPQTKYYLRLVATNEYGNTYFPLEFTTISLAPLVNIHETVDVTETTAVLYGEINPNSLSTSFHFEYGTTPALGLATPEYPVSDTTEFLKISAPVSGLSARQTYYYRLVATNGFASSATKSVKFFTAIKPVISSFTPATGPIGTEVVITGQNFNPIPEKNLVSFGATRATIVSGNSTEIKVQVPAGASLGPISLMDDDSGLITESNQGFVPTFTGVFTKKSLTLTMASNEYIYQTLVQDMDGDHKPDIVALHYLGFSVFVNVNQGGDVTEESFVRSIFNSEFTPGTLFLVDFDGNGLKDIATRYLNTFRIYPNLSVPGFVFFGTPVELPITSSVQNIVFDDFDIDGRIDMAGKTYLVDSTAVIILRNENPKGVISADNFEPRYVIKVPYTYGLYGEDLDNDGRPELLGVTYDGTVIPMLKNNSEPGVFDFKKTDGIQNSPSTLVPRYFIQDLNQDGWKDIVSHPSSSDRIANLNILQNNGATPNISMKAPVSALSGYASTIIRPGDLDGDGKVDLMVGLNKGKFALLKNNTLAGMALSSSSFEKFAEYGADNSASSHSTITINDLNGDGRPEVINTYSYNTLSQIGYMMEVWQNGPVDCIDPSPTTVRVTSTTATIELPENTTFDQFEMDYTRVGSAYWERVYNPTFYVYYGYSYQLRVRARCYMGFTEYYYLDFFTDCVNTSNFSISNINITSATASAYNLSSIEVGYSMAEKDQWQTLPQTYNNSSSQITNLLPGTTYDVRYRGRCTNPAGYSYKQFTTLCPNLESIGATDIAYNKATVTWKSNYTGTAILEYSADNSKWILVDETKIISSLTPGKQYFIRGKFACTDTNSNYIYNSFTTPCPKVSNLLINNITPFTASVSWVDESNTGNYTLTYSLPTGTLKTIQTSSTSVDIEGLSAGTQYTVSVAPHCIATKAFTSTTFNTVCYSPSDLSVEDITFTTADLFWSDDIGVLPYSVDYSIEGSNIWQTKETSSMNISLADLRPGTTYEARVHITCMSQEEPYVSLQFTTELYDATTIAPNPTDGDIKIFPSKDLIGNRFSILGNAGIEVAGGNLSDYSMDLSKLSPGVYILKISGEKPMKILKK